MKNVLTYSAMRSPKRFLSFLVFGLGLFLAGALSAETPAVGAVAPSFTLSTPAGKPVSLANETGKQKLVLVVLRGYPGYQCPFCQKQVHDFVAHASGFAEKGARVLLVYPGPPAELDAHAKDFLKGESDLPSNITLVTDPNYTMTNQYGLRWDAPHETAYPSTFILDKSGAIQFEKISHAHGDRTSAEDILNRL